MAAGNKLELTKPLSRAVCGGTPSLSLHPQGHGRPRGRQRACRCRYHGGTVALQHDLRIRGMVLFSGFVQQFFFDKDGGAEMDRQGNPV